MGSETIFSVDSEMICSVVSEISDCCCVCCCCCSELVGSDGTVCCGSDGVFSGTAGMVWSETTV